MECGRDELPCIIRRGWRSRVRAIVVFFAVTINGHVIHSHFFDVDPKNANFIPAVESALIHDEFGSNRLEANV